MTFADQIRDRDATTYADFLLPHLDQMMRMLDAGCGNGSISVGLASHCGFVTALDAEAGFDAANAYARSQGIANLMFETGDINAMRYDGNTFDACFCHSVLEALTTPEDALCELFRVLKPGGLVALASVDYGGILIGGDDTGHLRGFYQAREQLWISEGLADPFFGRRLRSLALDAGFARVQATAKYINHGTDDAVRRFGLARAGECRDTWFSRHAIEHDLLSAAEVEQTARAWEHWSESKGAFFAFPLVSHDRLETRRRSAAMKPVPFDYERVASIEEALDRLAREPDARILAGGQSLIPMLAMRLARPSLLIDIGAISELRTIADTAEHVAVGATTRHRDVEFSTLIQRKLPLLRGAVGYVGHAPIRARGTLGGSIVHADPAAEIPLVAATLGATLTIATTDGVDTIQADDFFFGPMLTAMPQGGCLTEVRFPVWTSSAVGTSFLEVSSRRSDFALVAVAAQIATDRDGRCSRVAFGIAGVGDYPERLELDGLVGLKPSPRDIEDALRDALSDTEAIDDVHASGAYRLRAATSLGTRALEHAFGEAIGQASL